MREDDDSDREDIKPQINSDDEEYEAPSPRKGNKLPLKRGPTSESEGDGLTVEERDALLRLQVRILLS